VQDVQKMKNITLSADDDLIEAARARARAENTTLNEAFRRWLMGYARRDTLAPKAMEAIKDLQTRVKTGGLKFTRDQMNER
jgi:hypothetical protein